MFIFAFYVLLCVHSSFPIILRRKRNRVALLLLSNKCFVTINVLWPFLTVPWFGLQCMIVLFPDYTHLLFEAAGVTGEVLKWFKSYLSH